MGRRQLLLDTVPTSVAIVPSITEIPDHSFRSYSILTAQARGPGKANVNKEVLALEYVVMLPRFLENIIFQRLLQDNNLSLFFARLVWPWDAAREGARGGRSCI